MVLADSKAILAPGRVLAQHQTALSLLQEMAQNPGVDRVRWLDLACGRGQILDSVQGAIPPRRRVKIYYRGVDVSHENARQTESLARTLFRDVDVDICELCFFERHLAADELFDFVTCTNTLHEMAPQALAETLASAICRLDCQGCLYFYDMEQLPEAELGAVPWHGSEVQRVLDAMLGAAGVREDAFPDVSIWPHRSCSCWHVQLHRAHICIADFREHREAMVAAGTPVIAEILQQKLLSTNSALESACRYGAETLSEGQEIHRLLFDFWAVARSLSEPIRLGTQLPEVTQCQE